ncbi:MAG: molybdenum cofactor guanylyltransferase [Anaerolineae bacterium]|nr:molybdenum cofactor guanylyltransferase [Anaerolineae bacterium]
MPALSGIILSGGQSRRMGQDKAFLALGGQRLIDRVAQTLGQVCDDLIVVANDVERYRGSAWRVVPDAFPGAGSLGGLYTGLQAARYPYVVTVACDMPFLNVDLLRYLADAAQGWDASIPRAPIEGMTGRGRRRDGSPTAKDVDLQPLHAVYHRRVARPIRARIAAGDLRMIGFLSSVRVRYVSAEDVRRLDPQGVSFLNANTPEEWQAVLERLDG